MGVLKNDVGRPSNKTIIIRRILKGTLLLIIVALAFLIGYHLNGKKENNKVEKKYNNSLKNESKNMSFDLNQITTKCTDDDCSGRYIYVYGKEIDTQFPIVDILKKNTIDDIAILEVQVIDSLGMIIVNKEGNILYNSEMQKDIENVNYISEEKNYEELYGYKINNKKIKFTMGQYLDLDSDYDHLACNLDKSDIIYSEYEMKYVNNKLSKPKLISSMKVSQFISKHNIDCSHYSKEAN